jgi:hypothetical protein
MEAGIFFENVKLWWMLLPFLLLAGYEAWQRRAPGWLVLIRGSWIVGLVFLLADLQQMLSREWSQAKPIRVLIDRSDSIMRIPDRQKKSEMFFNEIKEWSEKEGQPIETYIFSDSLISNPQSQLGVPPFSEWTSLVDISQFPRSTANIILLSDGNFRYSGLPQDRIFGVQIGEPDEKDLWIESAPNVLTAFLKNRVNFQVSVGQIGFQNTEAEIFLKRGAEILDRRKFQLNSRLEVVDLSYFPEKMGEDIFTIELKPLEGEISTINNTTYTRIRTVRDKIRILHISGKPSMDLKAWRLFLTKQPDVDLVSFYILRSLDDDPGAKSHELSLIPFPYEELFTTELEKFDLVILQNFNFNLYFQPFYLRNLANFVESGGALLMMGGDQSFQNYRFSPLAPILPVSFRSGAYETGRYGLSPIKAHPITDGLQPSMRALSWNSRHDLLEKKSATHLFSFLDEVPLLSINDYGRGRVVTLNTDESWRLHFEQPGDSLLFGKLARRLIQWLTFDPEMEPKKILSSSWRIGENVNLRLSDGRAVDWRVTFGSKSWNFTGQSQVDFKVEQPGIYEVFISELNETYRFETEEKPWLFEWRYLISQNQNLKQMAKQTDGNFYEWKNRRFVLQKSLDGRQIIAASSQSWLKLDSYWLWIFLASIILVLCLDFFLRKKFGWDL